MKEYTVDVIQTIKVTLDESKFDEKFIEEFQQIMFNYDTIEEHAIHLAQLYARGIADNNSFIEGYGESSDMGINFIIENQYEELYPDKKDKIIVMS